MLSCKKKKVSFDPKQKIQFCEEEEEIEPEEEKEECQEEIYKKTLELLNSPSIIHFQKIIIKRSGFTSTELLFPSHLNLSSSKVQSVSLYKLKDSPFYLECLQGETRPSYCVERITQEVTIRYRIVRCMEDALRPLTKKEEQWKNVSLKIFFCFDNGQLILWKHKIGLPVDGSLSFFRYSRINYVHDDDFGILYHLDIETFEEKEHSFHKEDS